MAEIRVPDLSEEIKEATVGEWMKQEGDAVEIGDVLLILETDKVSQEIVSEFAGVLQQIAAPEDEDVTVGDLLAVIDADGSAPAPSAESETQTPPTPQPAPTASAAVPTPVAMRAAQAHGVDIQQVPAADGKRITKEDVEAYAQQQNGGQPSAPPAPKPAPQAAKSTPQKPPQATSARPEERVKLSRRRRTIADRLVAAQSEAAMLTTFNEVDMHGVMELRKRRKEAFKEKHGVSLGLSSFFVKATVGALKAFPRINAEIDGKEMVLKKYYDIGIAIGDEEGLVVPVLRDADRLSFYEIESQIRVYAKQIQEGSLPIDALMGGTFTITNGGVFGSLLSTPILNTPQVGILGLHGIQERPVVVDGEITIRPMMYMALTYDHRIVDGREAVQFLVKLKQYIEDPEMLLIEG